MQKFMTSGNTHINAERLLAVATDSSKNFLPVEFQHLKACVTCLDEFAQYVQQNEKSSSSATDASGD
jgi:hypothetical protein